MLLNHFLTIEMIIIYFYSFSFNTSQNFPHLNLNHPIFFNRHNFQNAHSINLPNYIETSIRNTIPNTQMVSQISKPPREIYLCLQVKYLLKYMNECQFGQETLTLNIIQRTVSFDTLGIGTIIKRNYIN